MASSQRVKNHRKWAPLLLKWLYDHDIIYCEWPGCNSTFGIAPAHRITRWQIHTIEEYFLAALLCQPHHKFVDQGDGTPENPGAADRQSRLILELIENRQ